MMKTRVKISVCFFLIAIGVQVKAQQQVMFTQYMFNQLALNPAYAGIHEGISTSFLARYQWVGFEGAPKTQTFSIHTPINYRPIAVGAVIIRDQIGITDQFGGHFSFAYRIKVFKQSKLSFGIQASINQYQADFTSNPNNDPNLVGQNINDFSVNFGTGIMWHSDRFYVGFSIPQLVNNSIDDGLDASVNANAGQEIDPDAEMIRHYFLTGGYVFELNQNLKMKPNVLLKWVTGAPVQVDVNLNFLINELVWLGLSYRSLDSFDALVQFQISPNMQIGYSYDFWTTSELSRVNSGSHEIMINFVFNKRTDRIVTPRYF